MKGYMRQRGPSWELRVFLGNDPVNGKQRYATRSVRGGKREAQRVLAEMVTHAEHGLTARTNATVGELLEAWFDLACRDFSPKTVKETRGAIDRYLTPALGARPLSKVRSSDLDLLYRRLQNAGGVDGRALSPATVRRIHGILRRALAQGVRWGWLGVNPAAAASPPRVAPPDISPPDREQLARLLRRATVERPDLACFLMLAAATGARRSELVALRWDDVDAGIVTIARAVVSGPDGLVEKNTKTHTSRRVSLDAGTAGAVAAHRDRMLARARATRTDMRLDAFVFSNSADGSEPWFPDSVSRSFRRLCAKEKISHVRLHDLRHFVATQLLSAGVDVRTVAGRLGHRNAATTLNVYAHFLQQADQRAADIIGSVIALDEIAPSE